MFLISFSDNIWGILKKVLGEWVKRKTIAYVVFSVRFFQTKINKRRFPPISFSA